MNASTNSPSRFNKVVLSSGHLVDTDDRKTPRFPRNKVDAVRACLSRELEKWGIGPGDLAICGGARGGDILFAELCAERGAEVWLFIALDETAFLQQSVRLPDSDWEDRYFKLRGSPGVKTFWQNERIQAPSSKDISPFASANLWMVDTARSIAAASGDLYAVLVWDELPAGDGPGGTADFAEKVRELGGHLAIINPAKLPF